MEYENGSYFTNLLHQGSIPNGSFSMDDDDEANGNMFEEPVVRSETGGQNRRAPKRKERALNYSEKEDLLLVSAWLNVGIDPITGNDQKSDAYWERFCEYFHAHKTFVSDRNYNSLQHRWTIIQASVNKLCGFYEQIQNRPKSGENEQDKILRAKLMYKEEMNKAFTQEHSWIVMRNHPKWIALNAKKNETARETTKRKRVEKSQEVNGAINLEKNNCSTTQPASMEQPIGQKKAKDLLKKEKANESLALELQSELKRQAEQKKEERFQMSLAQEKELISLKAKKEQAKEQREDDRIMLMDLTTLTPRQAEYMKDRQEEIMAKRTKIRLSETTSSAHL